MILFENDGTLDMRAVKVMGVSAKDEDRSVIGYFGTGLKYAIAVLLRTGHDIVIHDGTGKQHKLGSVSRTIRDKKFNIVTLNAEELGFTTELGKTWKVWMAFRELHCNATDEGGKSREVQNETFDSRDPDKVRIMVSGSEIDRVWNDRDKYILSPKRKPEFDTPGVQVFCHNSRLGGNGIIFYRGINVGDTESTCAYDFNLIDQLDLTEDRTIRYSHFIHRIIGNAVLNSSDKDFIIAMMKADSPYSYIAKLSMLYSADDPGSFFLDTIGELRREYKDHSSINKDAIALHKKHREKNVMPTKSCKLNKVQTVQLKRAQTFCNEQLGLDTLAYPLVICEDLGGDNILGRADMENNIMYLSRSIFSKGTKHVVMGLIEEFTHLRYRVYDETLEQKIIYLELIASLGEQLQGEPL